MSINIHSQLMDICIDGNILMNVDVIMFSNNKLQNYMYSKLHDNYQKITSFY